MAAPLDPDVLERLRTVGLRIDGRGQLWHQGDPVTHDGLRRALLRWLDVRADDDRVIIRLDDVRYAYIDVDDTPLRITAIRWDDQTPIASIDDGSTEALAMTTVIADPDGRLRAQVRNARMAARFTSAAQQVLIEHAAERDGVLGVDAVGQFWPLATAE
jgi:hypothetical protein